MKAFTKKDWILLSLSGIIALGGVIYTHFIPHDAQSIPIVLTNNTKHLDLKDMRYCDNNGDCSQKLDDVLAKKP